MMQKPCWCVWEHEHCAPLTSGRRHLFGQLRQVWTRADGALLRLRLCRCPFLSGDPAGPLP